MAPASDNNNQDLATKKAKLETNSTVLGGVGKYIDVMCFNVSLFNRNTGYVPGILCRRF